MSDPNQPRTASISSDPDPGLMFCVDPATGEGYMPLAYYALMAEQITELLAQIATLKLAIAKAALILKAFEHAPLPDHEVVAGVVRERCGSDSPG